MRFFKINYMYLSGTWRKTFLVLDSNMFPDEDATQNYLSKRMTWVDKVVVTDIKEISHQQYLKYNITHSIFVDEK